MTGPVSNEERERTMTGLKMVTVLLVGLSAGLITSQGDASPVVVAAAVLSGLLVGAALVRFLFPSVEQLAPASNREYRR